MRKAGRLEGWNVENRRPSNTHFLHPCSARPIVLLADLRLTRGAFHAATGRVEQEIHGRTDALALSILTLGTDPDYRLSARRTIIRQLVRAATSVGANVEEAAGAHTKADFIAKMSIARRKRAK